MAALRYFFSLLMIPVTFVAAIASGLAFLAAYIPPEESGTIAFASLAMPAILLVNVLILVYWAIQKENGLSFQQPLFYGIFPFCYLFFNSIFPHQLLRKIPLSV